MLIERLSDLRAFLAIVERGGISAAARSLGRSVQSVSRSLASVEQALGVELIRRTTRTSNATAAGDLFYRRVAAALCDMETAAAEVSGAHDTPMGTLRITASTRFAPVFLVPAIASFLDRHRQVDVDLCLRDDYVDLFTAGYDIAVRIGPMADSSLRVRRLAELRRVTFAAPSYFAEHGRPLHPSDLANHSCIVRSAGQDGAAWTYRINGKLHKVVIGGRLRTDNAEAANQAAVSGIGIANASYWQVCDLIDNGALEIVLGDFEPPTTGVHAVWPPSAHVPAKTRLFVDHLAAFLKTKRF